MNCATSCINVAVGGGGGMNGCFSNRHLVKVVKIGIIVLLSPIHIFPLYAAALIDWEHIVFGPSIGPFVCASACTLAISFEWSDLGPSYFA